MNRRLKRGMAGFLVLIMTLSILPIMPYTQAEAAETEAVNYVTLTKVDECTEEVLAPQKNGDSITVTYVSTALNSTKQFYAELCDKSNATVQYATTLSDRLQAWYYPRIDGYDVAREKFVGYEMS